MKARFFYKIPDAKLIRNKTDKNKGKEVEDELVMNDETVSEDQTANEVSQDVAATEEVKDSETK